MDACKVFMHADSKACVVVGASMNNKGSNIVIMVLISMWMEWQER